MSELVDKLRTWKHSLDKDVSAGALSLILDDAANELEQAEIKLDSCKRDLKQAGEWLAQSGAANQLLQSRLGAVRSRCEEVRDMSGVMERAEFAEEILDMLDLAVESQEIDGERPHKSWCALYGDPGAGKECDCAPDTPFPELNDHGNTTYICGAVSSGYLCDLPPGHEGKHSWDNFRPEDTAPDRHDPDTCVDMHCSLCFTDASDRASEIPLPQAIRDIDMKK